MIDYRDIEFQMKCERERIQGKRAITAMIIVLVVGITLLEWVS